MSCKICGRSACTTSFHSLKEQEEWETKTGMYAHDESVSEKGDKEMSEPKTSQGPTTVQEWKAAYFRMMEMRDSLQAENSRLRSELERANRERDLAQARNEKLERVRVAAGKAIDDHSNAGDYAELEEALAACEEKPGVPKAE